MSTELIFEEPPTTQGRPPGSPFTEWLLALRSHPGRWAKYPEAFSLTSGAAPAKVNKIRNGGFAQIPAGEYDAKTRAADGQRWVYARYLGES